jgi:uncharacterized OB-fold protein
MNQTILQPPADFSPLSLPDLEGEWKEYWAGTACGELRIQHCASCGSYQFYPRIICTACGGEPHWVRASGLGTLHTFTIVRQNMVAPFKAMLPYVLGIVELAESVRMMTNIVDCPLEAVTIGMPLRVRFVEAKPGIVYPYWRPG